MNWGWVFTGIGILISIGAVVVAVTTRINDIAHVREEQEKQAKDIKELFVAVSNLRESVARIEGKMNGEG
jgi:hypothetical protein